MLQNIEKRVERGGKEDIWGYLGLSGLSGAIWGYLGLSGLLRGEGARTPPQLADIDRGCLSVNWVGSGGR